MSNYKPSLLYIISQRLKGRHFLYEFYFRGKKTLDIGCGEGEFLKVDQKNIYGVDANARAIEILLKSGFHVKQGNVAELPYATTEFDAVHCRNVIEHLEIEDAYQLIKEAARVLKSGGIFILASEVATKKFWTTFGHVKPYPPEAIIKLLRKESREEFEGIENLEYLDILYFGDFFNNKLSYLISICLAYYTPFFRREYFLVLRKK
ncbi:MAG: methyltransferase domain-containing protein [Patescibacteria group bacterium]